MLVWLISRALLITVTVCLMHWGWWLVEFTAIPDCLPGTDSGTIVVVCYTVIILQQPVTCG